MHFIGAAELLTVEILILISYFHLRLRPLSTLGCYFVQLLVLWGHLFCLLSGDRRLSVSRRLKPYYICGKSIGGTLFVHCMEVVCILDSPLWEVPL